MKGHELRQRRLAMGLSQQELANILGVTQNAISRWESGKVTIRHDVILQWAMTAVEQDRGRKSALGEASDVGQPDIA